MANINYTDYWDVSDTSVQLSGKHGTLDASFYSDPSFNGMNLLLNGPKLIIQCDVSMAKGYLYLEQSVTGTNYLTVADSSLAFDSSMTKTCYMKEYTGLFPQTRIRAILPIDCSNLIGGHIDTITMRNVT